jgi:multisubunit Na+/H+ antiporter MnhB subunit
VTLAFEIGLAGLLVAIAAWTILVRDMFAAVLAFVVYGLLLSLAWVRLSAVDVALTEAAIGSGVTGMLLLGAAARLHGRDGAVKIPSVSLRVGAGLLCALVSAGLALIVLPSPDVAPTLAWEAMENLPATGLGNPVAGVLFVYRALDTLLEKVVLLLALVGVWSLAPDHAWGGVPELRAYDSRNGALTLLAQILPPIGIMIGIYMAWVGANQPGGAFQGGALLAAMWLLVMFASLRRAPPISRLWVRGLLVIGPAIFLTIGFAGFVLAEGFLSYPTGFAKPLIVVAEVTLTLSIAVTLALLTAGRPERQP